MDQNIFYQTYFADFAFLNIGFRVQSHFAFGYDP